MIKQKIAQDKIEQGSKNWIGYVKKHPVKAPLITDTVRYFLSRVKLILKSSMTFKATRRQIFSIKEKSHVV